MMNRGSDEGVVTYEAADRGASCCLGCWAWLMILTGVGLGLWFIAGDAWKLIVGSVLVIAGIGVLLFMRSSRRGRWEIRLDRDRRELTLVSREHGEEVERVIAFDQIVAVELEPLTRDVSTGEGVRYLRPVFYLRSGEQVPVDERLSIKRPDRAEEFARQMRDLLGLTGLEDAGRGG